MKTMLTGLFFFVLGMPLLQAQIKGRVLSVDSVPVAMASVSLARNDQPISRTFTDSSGYFSFKISGDTSAGYCISASAVGFLDTVLPVAHHNKEQWYILLLQKDEKMLSAVTVTTSKPLITRKSDRYIVNVEDSYLSTGNTALELLQRSPGIWVSGDGSIKISGNESVTVMINDVVQRMSGTELADYLRSLRSEDISKIEVIPNPPAEFEAAATGGIIHIVLKKNRLTGLSGNLSAQYRQQQARPYTSTGVSIDYKSSRWYSFGSLNFSNDQSVYDGWSTVTYPDQSTLHNTTIRKNNNTRYQFRTGLAYDISKDHSVNFQLNGNLQHLDQHFYPELLYVLPGKTITGKTTSHWDRKPKQFSYTVYYNWRLDSTGSYLKLIADHTRSSKTEINKVNSSYSDPSDDRQYRTFTPNATTITSIQADHLQKLRRQFILTSGLKIVSTTRNNTVLRENYLQDAWIKDIAGSNEFRYTETIWMFYSSLERSSGKTTVKAGLRGEQTISNGYSITSAQSIRRNYFGLFPSLFISRIFNEDQGNSAFFNYSRRIRRPGYNDLNPYRLQVHDFTVMTGNPGLQPQYTNSFRLGYTYHRQYNVAAYVQITDGFIAQAGRLVDSNIVEYRSENYPGSYEYGLSMDAAINFSRVWTTQNNLMIYKSSSQLDAERFEAVSARLQSVQNFSWPHILDAFLTAYYNIPYWTGNTRQAYVFSIDAGISRKLWKDRGRLRFFVSDIFNTAREKELTILRGTRIDFYQKRPTRTFSIALNYQFQAGKKFTRKNIETHTNEEKNRL
ncbi:MAG: outer membrane beta-barrel protein [Chitinophagaceae bacterium]